MWRNPRLDIVSPRIESKGGPGTEAREIVSGGEHASFDGGLDRRATRPHCAGGLTLADARGLAGRHAIEAYGSGGFQFGGMSHRGALLLLPSGVHPWTATTSGDITRESLAPLFAEADLIDHLLVGTGADFAPLDASLLAACRAKAIVAEPMATAAAARTYNILLGERRRVAAALLPAG